MRLIPLAFASSVILTHMAVAQTPNTLVFRPNQGGGFVEEGNGNFILYNSNFSYNSNGVQYSGSSNGGVNPFAVGQIAGVSNGLSIAAGSYVYSYLITAPTAVAANNFAATMPPVIAAGTYSLDASGGGSAQYFLLEQLVRNGSYFGNLLGSGNCSIAQSSNCGTFTYSTPLTVTRVNLTQFGGRIGLNAQALLSGSGSASAYLDPTISIDQTFLNLNPGFMITQNLDLSAVPEPQAWILMMLGVGVVGAGLRRGRTTVSYSFNQQ